MVNENGFMQFWTDVYNFLKDGGAGQAMYEQTVKILIAFDKQHSTIAMLLTSWSFRAQSLMVRNKSYYGLAGQRPLHPPARVSRKDETTT